MIDRPPGRWFYVLGAGVAVGVFGICLVVASLVGSMGFLARIGSLPRATVPGSVQLELAAGDYTAYYETHTVVEGRAYQAGPPGDLSCGLTGPSGSPIELRPSAAAVSYAVGSYSGQSIFVFRVPQDGRYTLACDSAQPDRRSVLAVGRGQRWSAPALLVGGVGGLLLGLGFCAVVYGRRRRWARRQPFAAGAERPPSAPWPAGVGVAHPPGQPASATPALRPGPAGSDPAPPAPPARPASVGLVAPPPPPAQLAPPAPAPLASQPSPWPVRPAPAPLGLPPSAHTGPAPAAAPPWPAVTTAPWPAVTAPPWPAGARPPAAGNDGVAVAALVLGILGIVVVAIPLAIIGLSRTRTGSHRGGRGVAMSALAVSAGWALVAAVAVITLIPSLQPGRVVAAAAASPSAPATSPSAPAASPSAPAASPSAPPSAEVGFAELRVGDCIQSQPGPSTDSLTRVSCAVPHALEVIGFRDLGRGPWPGERVLGTRGDRLCSAVFQSYVGIPVDRSELDLVFYFPEEEAWRDGDHMAHCFASHPVIKKTGTVRGSRR